MLAEFQDIFVDPDEHSPLQFEGESRDGRWYHGCLHSARGQTWPVREGIPNFGAEAQGDPWTDDMIKDFLSNGIYERNWRSANGLLDDERQGTVAACREITDRGLPIVDIASGPGGGFMPAILTLNPNAVVMAMDASAPVLYGWKEYFDSQRIALNVCFAGFDATKMPLASNSVDVMTSAVGFSSVRRDQLLAWREAARVLAPEGIIYAAEIQMEPDGLKLLSVKMGWNFEERFGPRYKMSFREMFDACGLDVFQERPYFRRKMHPGDNDIARTACEVGVELWTGGNVYWLVKRR